MSAPDPAAAIEVRGLDIVVNRPDGQRTVIVEDISFSIPRGEVLALIGESGSGKTTIALAMLGYSRFGADITADCLRVGDMRIDRMPGCAAGGSPTSHKARPRPSIPRARSWRR